MSIEASKKPRINSSGHRLIYEPKHPSAYTTGSWTGYVYEHRFIVEKELGRQLSDNEVVHHLDGNPGNNQKENLLVLTKGMHVRLHAWLDAGAPGVERLRVNRVNSGKTNPIQTCEVCGRTIAKYLVKFCSQKCYRAKAASNSKRPNFEELRTDLQNMNYCQVGKKYAVSDNAVRKWVKYYEKMGMSILSQAEGTPSEGAETTGEVESS